MVLDPGIRFLYAITIVRQCEKTKNSPTPIPNFWIILEKHLKY